MADYNHVEKLFKQIISSKSEFMDKKKLISELLDQEPRLINSRIKSFYINGGLFEKIPVSAFFAICMEIPYSIPYYVKNYNADINQKLGNIPLLTALSSFDLTHENACITLIKMGANVNAKITDSGITALMACTYKDNIKVLKTLIEYGAKIDAKSDTGNTALIFACRAMAVECVKYLIKMGADVNATNKYNPNMNSIYHLLSESWWLNARNTTVDETKQVIILKELLKAGADVFMEPGVINRDTEKMPRCRKILQDYINGVAKVLKHKQMKLPEHIDSKILMYLGIMPSKAKRSSKKSKRH